MADVDHDLILAGGGFASGLVALAFRRMRPDLDVAVVERGATIGGNHIWSLFASDIEPPHRSRVDTPNVHLWPGYDVRVRAHSRTLATGYNTLLPDARDRRARRKTAVEERGR